jgi:hypothetical protein
MKVSTEIDNNFGYEKITQLVDNIPLRYKVDVFLQSGIRAFSSGLHVVRSNGLTH